jgi:epsilon-lactone hydrolase
MKERNLDILPVAAGPGSGLSPECVNTLDFIREWTAEVLARNEPFDLARVRKNFKIASRPADVVAQNVFSVQGVPCEWVCAPGSDPGARLLYLHGGGFVSGDLDTTIPFARLISQATGCSVLAVDYRLAPEHPFPRALTDAVRCFRWLREHGPRGPGPARKRVVAGDSAGGGLVLSTLMRLRDAGETLPDCAVTLSPITDLSLSGASLETQADRDPVLRKEFLRFCSDAYACGTDRREPLLSPLFGDPAGLPPLFMQVGGREILLDDTLRFVRKAKAAGVDVTLDLWPDMFHSWQLFAPGVPEAQQALDRIGVYIREGR